MLKRQWTVADLKDLPDDGNRYEVIDGELLVTPAPSLSHQSAAGRLFTLLDGYVSAQKLGYVFFAPADVVFSPKRGVQPDIFVAPPVDGRRPRTTEQLINLLLTVEILSPSTARADRIKKRNLYRDESVPEYWIVDLDARCIERSTPGDARPEVLESKLVWTPLGASASLEIDLADYFAHVLDD